ncbi:subclass B1 metallo-beta-lactamase [Pontibacter sp. JAM-7]|uniref:subclass B1 metallo-beta-lactamase n=1 Tax=Pontibacter sp. JAM-7 TaxID=3366581 RepID=UPI003AF9E06E
MNIRFILSSILIILFSFNSMAASSSGTDIQIKKIDDGVWLHTSFYIYPNGIKFPSNGLIIKEGQSLTLIDTAWGELQTVNLLRAIELHIKLPVTQALVTHAHSDRASGVDVLESAGVNVFAHPLTKQLTIEQGAPVPDNVIHELNEAGAAVKFGSLEVFFPGAGHAMDNLMVWLPERKILFGGCAIRSLDAKSAGNIVHGDINSWLKITKQLKGQYKDADIVVPGHGEVGGVELFEHTEKLIHDKLKTNEH